MLLSGPPPTSGPTGWYFASLWQFNGAIDEATIKRIAREGSTRARDGGRCPRAALSAERCIKEEQPPLGSSSERRSSVPVERCINSLRGVSINELLIAMYSINESL